MKEEITPKLLIILKAVFEEPPHLFEQFKETRKLFLSGVANEIKKHPEAYTEKFKSFYNLVICCYSHRVAYGSLPPKDALGLTELEEER